jgi:hypothetical protein
MRSRFRKVTAVGLALIFTLSITAGAQSSRRQNKDKSDDQAPISIMDSTEAQWGMRSVNDSVYQGYPMNAVYLERGRTRLPDSFPKYTPKPLGNEIVVRSSDQPTPSTIRVNGVETPLEKAD